MREMTLLTITNDAKFLALFRRRFHGQLAGGSRVFVTRTVEDACSLLNKIQPRLIIVHWTHGTDSYEQLDQLLWATTVQARPIPVLVIAERYRTDQATMMYRMGVIDYVSRTHHLDRLGSVLSAYLAPTRVAAPADAGGIAGKAWSLSHEPSLATQAV